MGRLKYPLSILPKQTYLPKISIDILDQQIPLVVIRRSDKPKQDIFNKFGELREDAIVDRENDILGMSMNLLGAAFKPEFIKFNPTKEAAKDGMDKKLFYIQNIVNLYKNFL